MIKKIFLFSGLLMIGLAKSQIVHIPDENFKTYLLTNPAINSNNDTEIQLSEAVAFTGTIHCSDFNISSLEGIEAFVNLTKLWCYNNQLRHLNVSQNTALIDLQCDGNRLTTLDLSNNLALKTLWCHINQLTILNVSKNVVLKNLMCYENQLTELDVSENLALEKLHCHLNNLKNLDVSKNLVLKDLFCSWNDLISLNIKNENNGAFQRMIAKNNPNLSCIQVDNVVNASSYNNWIKDVTTNYNTDCDYMSVNEVQKSEIGFYPNPVNDMLHFSQKITDFKIIDGLGKILKHGSNFVKSVDVEKLKKGIYIIVFKTISDKTITRKFIKQ